MLILLMLAACGKPQPERQCLSHVTQTFTTYPNIGLAGFGGAWTAVAAMPMVETRKVCVEYAPEMSHG